MSAGRYAHEEHQREGNDYERERDVKIIAQESAPDRLASLLKEIGIGSEKGEELGVKYRRMRSALSDKYMMLAHDEVIGYCLAIIAYQEKRIQALEEEIKKR